MYACTCMPVCQRLSDWARKLKESRKMLVRNQGRTGTDTHTHRYNAHHVFAWTFATPKHVDPDLFLHNVAWFTCFFCSPRHKLRRAPACREGPFVGSKFRRCWVRLDTCITPTTNISNRHNNRLSDHWWCKTPLVVPSIDLPTAAVWDDTPRPPSALNQHL